MGVRETLCERESVPESRSVIVAPSRFTARRSGSRSEQATTSMKGHAQNRAVADALAHVDGLLESG
jgi:hypothetical protein